MEQKLLSRFTYYVVHYRGLKQNEAPSYVRGLLFHGHPKYPREMLASAMPMIASEAKSSAHRVRAVSIAGCSRLTHMDDDVPEDHAAIQCLLLAPSWPQIWSPKGPLIAVEQTSR